MSALRISDLNHAFSGVAKLEQSEHGVHVDELHALADLDLISGPEMLPDSPVSRAFGRSASELLQLGPMPFPQSTPPILNAAVTRLLSVHAHNQGEPASSASSEDVVREAKMVLLVGQIHRLCQEISARSRRTV